MDFDIDIFKTILNYIYFSFNPNRVHIFSSAYCGFYFMSTPDHMTKDTEDIPKVHAENPWKQLVFKKGLSDRLAG